MEVKQQGDHEKVCSRPRGFFLLTRVALHILNETFQVLQWRMSALFILAMVQTP